MKLMWQYMSSYKKRIALTLLLKFLAVVAELLIPYILEYMIDTAAPAKEIVTVIWLGVAMALLALLARSLNVTGNRIATATARDSIRTLRHDLFCRTIYLSGATFDHISLPSLISEMTSDSYNVQSFIGMIQRMGVRSPIMLVGAISVAVTLDPVLALVLLCMVPILAYTVIYITRKGIPLFRKVQGRLDQVVRIMRENITGIRVIKGLSREEHEKARFNKYNKDLTNDDIFAGKVMALPGTVMTLFLNVGLTLVVIIGAARVNEGSMEVGVILAFLTYFNMITMAVMGIRRIFMMYSKAGASADRIASVLVLEDERGMQERETETADRPGGVGGTGNIEDGSHERISARHTAPALEFRDVSFCYESHGKNRGFEVRNISFSLAAGESIGIIGSTGSGKTTIVNLLMRLYDVSSGSIRMNGMDIRDMGLKTLRSNIGIVLQNDTIFNDTLAENISFGRDIGMDDVKRAASAALISDYIDTLEEGYDYMADIKGMNLSGGQRQRILIARALAGNPEYLVLDDSSSALDYATDAKLRYNLKNCYPDCTCVVIAQRVSSVKDLTHILVMEDGQAIGYGSHEELMECCEVYRDIADSQMGSL